eukprot:Phypoly_transcript_02406.p1 GENE.Phypoly_transcript_02406~~Phypoly_transcript_02406.p1  ORF type:complete len:885 (+),score=250.81 Phypoly_transcript_02406:99-2753(+)
MAQIEAPNNNMSFDLSHNSSHNDEFGGDDKGQTQKFIKIITTFASRVDISVCKAQGTIDVLLAQYNLPLTPKEVVEDNSSKIKSVMAVIRRAALLQRDVERLGQILITRTMQNAFSPNPAVVAAKEEEQFEFFDADALLASNDFLPTIQNGILQSRSADKLPAKLVDKLQSRSADSLQSPTDKLQSKSADTLPEKKEEQLTLKLNNGEVPKLDDYWPAKQDDDLPPKQEDLLPKQEDDNLPNEPNNIVPKQDNNLPKQDDLFSLEPEDSLCQKQNDVALPKADWVAVKVQKHERPSPPKVERARSPKPERALSPTPESPVVKPQRALLPNQESPSLKPQRALSPKPERPLSPKPDRALSLAKADEIPPVPKKEIPPPSAGARPNPPKSSDKPSTSNVRNLQAIFRDKTLYDPRQAPTPTSPKASARLAQPNAAQAKPNANASLLAKSLSASTISNSAPPPANALTKQTSLSGAAMGAGRVPPPPPKQNSVGNFSSTPPTNAGTPPVNASPPASAFKKGAAPNRAPLFQSSPGQPARVMQENPLRSSAESPARAIPLSPRENSPSPSPSSLPSSAPTTSFLSSTPPPSMVKAVLKGAPSKKPPMISQHQVSASPPSPASTPPANGTFGPTSPPKRPLRSSSNSPHPQNPTGIPLHSSFDLGASSPSTAPVPLKENSWSGAINISSPSSSHEEPTALSSSASNNEPLSDDSETGTSETGNPAFDPDDTDTATSSFYSQQSTTPPSTLNVLRENSESSENSAFASVPLDDPAPVHIEPPTTSHVEISEDLDDLGLDDDDDDDSIYEEDEKDKKKGNPEKFDTIRFKKDINALLDEIDAEEATPAKKVNPGIKNKLAPFFTKRPKNKQEMESQLKGKGIVPEEKKGKH